VLEDLTIDSFSGLVGERFQLEDGGSPCEFMLTECTRLGGASLGRIPFSLLFRGPVDPVLPQRVYRMRHAEFGTLELFLVPIGREPDGTIYEAVFT
jgi:hypothetical protein